MAHFLCSAEAVLSSVGCIQFSLVHEQSSRWQISLQARKANLYLTHALCCSVEHIFQGFQVRRHQNARSFRIGHNYRESFIFTFKRRENNSNHDDEINLEEFHKRHCEQKAAAADADADKL